MDALAQLVAKKKKDKVGGGKKKTGGWKRKADIEAERKRKYLEDEAEYEKTQEAKRRKKEEERAAANTPIETSYEARMLHWSNTDISPEVVAALNGDDLASMMAAYLTSYDTKTSNLRDAFLKSYKLLAALFKDEFIDGASLVEAARTGNQDDINQLHAMIWGKMEKTTVGKLGLKIRLRSFLKLCSPGDTVQLLKSKEKLLDNDVISRKEEEETTIEQEEPVVVSTESGAPPEEEAYSKEGYVDACVEYYLRLWKVEVAAMTTEEKGTREGRKIETRLAQTIEWLKPLQRLLRSENLKKDVLDGLGKMFAALGKKEFVKANRLYLEELAIGKAPWPMGATMVGIHARAAREKISEDKIAHVMNDEQTRKYIQCVKRLITVAERHHHHHAAHAAAGEFT